MGSTTYIISDGVPAEVFLPNRPHDAVTVLNQGPGTAYLSDVDVPEPANTGHPLAANSTIVWDTNRALFMATDGTCNVIVTDNAGAVFDASAIASEIITQGLPGSIATQISLTGVPTIDAAESILYTSFLTAGSAGSGGGGGKPSGGGAGGGTDTSGGTGTTSTPTAFVAGASGVGVSDGSFNAWLTSHDLGAAATWADQSASLQMTGGFIGSGEEFGNWQGIINIALGGIFGESWSQAASGAFDSRWTTAFQNAKSKWGTRPPGNCHIRFAHEFNGDFSEWKVSNADAANFRAAFIRWVNLQRQIFPGSKVVWSPNYGTSSMSNINDAWPGDAYVDIVGPDWYNNYPHGTTAADFTNGLNYSPGGNPQGLGAWLAFAAAHGKPMCIPEFGNPAADNGGGGGDAPAFNQALIQWMKANGGAGAGKVWYACYFNISSGYAARYSIFNDGASQPQTSAVYKANY